MPAVNPVGGGRHSRQALKIPVESPDCVVSALHCYICHGIPAVPQKITGSVNPVLVQVGRISHAHGLRKESGQVGILILQGSSGLQKSTGFIYMLVDIGQYLVKKQKLAVFFVQALKIRMFQQLSAHLVQKAFKLVIVPELKGRLG